VLAATIVAAFLRMFHLGAQSLWIDEVLTWYSTNPGHAFGMSAWLENVHGPLYAFSAHAAVATLGDHEWTLRLPAALCGIATVPALAWLAARWLGEREAQWTAWLAAASPFLIWYAQEARHYSMLILFVVVSGALVLELARRARLSLSAGYAAAALGGLLSNPSFAFVLPVHLKWWLGARVLRTRRVAVAALGALLVIAFALPWAPRVLETWDWGRLDPGRAVPASETPLRGITTFHAAAIPFAMHAFAVGYSLGPSLRELRADPSFATVRRHLGEIALTALVFGVLGFRGLIALAKRRRLADALLWIAIPTLVVSWFALANFKVFHPRYLAACYPAFLMLLAAALTDAKPRARWMLGLGVAALWIASLVHYFGDPAYGKEDHRAAAALIAAHGSSGEKVLAVNSIDPMMYYYRGPLRLEPFWLGFASDPARLTQRFGAAVDSASGAWVVLSRAEDLDPAGHFAAWMDARYAGAERFRFDGVRVWHLRRTGDIPG
jgi:mannosyltransferase